MHLFNNIKFLFCILIISINLPINAYEEGYADNNGIKIYYRDYGPKNAEPILLVQGLGGQLTFWPENLINFLKDNNFRPIVYDNRDVGLSTKFNNQPNYTSDYLRYIFRLPIDTEYVIDDMAMDGISILDTLNIKKAHLLGMSMGGMIAQIIASNYSERIKSFTLIASTSMRRVDTRSSLDLLTQRTDAAAAEELTRRLAAALSLVSFSILAAGVLFERRPGLSGQALSAVFLIAVLVVFLLLQSAVISGSGFSDQTLWLVLTISIAPIALLPFIRLGRRLAG